MPSPRQPADAFVGLPDPSQAGTLDDLVERLRMLKHWAGDPSYESIKDRVNATWLAAGRPPAELAGKTTVVDCFRAGRRRLNTDLVESVVRALHPDVGYVTQWRQALRVIGGETRAAAQVRVHDTLPRDLAAFTGRTAELDRLRQALRYGIVDGEAVVISAIAGMAGIGKTQLAIHAGHMLARDKAFDRVLFVNLRGFHPDPVQPPADPAAVLDGFLRLLGVPGQQIPHDLDARAAAYRSRLAGTRTLVVLDNAADENQVRPLLPQTPDCPVLVTSRRSLTALRTARHIRVDLFTPDEAVAFLVRAAPQVPVGPDPDAALRIARRCGYLPLALGLVAGHIRAMAGWTLTDHADRLGERLRDRRLDTGVELALDLSYQHLPADQRRLLRLLALHPGQDFDIYAAAALVDRDLHTTRNQLDVLHRDHVLQQGLPGRYMFHDLVRAYAIARAGDEDPPPERRAALTRLFDYYLSTTAVAMDTVYPAEAHRRPRIPPAGTPMPALIDRETARGWLGTQRPTLVAVAAHTAVHGWPAHTVQMSATLFRYLEGGHPTDALIVHGRARDAAQHCGDPAGHAHALTDLGVAHLQLSQHEPAAEHFQQALVRYRQVDDPAGEARALGNLGVVETRLGRYRLAADHFELALALYQQSGDRLGEARGLDKLGIVETRLGRYSSAADHLYRALHLFREVGDRIGEADTLNNFGHVEVRLRRYASAAAHLQQALILCRQLGNGAGEAWTLDNLGTLHSHLGQTARATGYHQQALTILREIGDRDGETWALNGLGEAAHTDGRDADARTLHTAAHIIAADIGDRDQHARAHAGLGQAHLALADPVNARHHYQRALALYTDLGTSHAGQIRAQLSAI